MLCCHMQLHTRHSVSYTETHYCHFFTQCGNKDWLYRRDVSLAPKDGNLWAVLLTPPPLPPPLLWCCTEGLPECEAAGLIGRVWIWKPNKLPRKAPKIAERKIHPKTENLECCSCDLWELLHWQLMGHQASHRTLVLQTDAGSYSLQTWAQTACADITQSQGLFFILWSVK